MTFDEVIKGLRGNRLSEPITVGDTIKIVKSLKEYYAPTVEMTKRQKDNLISTKKEGYSFVETIADIDSGVLIREFDSYWKPLTQEQLMQAWLHPETIKVVEEEK